MQDLIQTLQQKFAAGSYTKAAELTQNWRLRLALDCPEQSAATRDSIVCWLIGEDLGRFDLLDPTMAEITRQAMAYRYRLLQQRYLGQPPGKAYRNLMTRLGSLVVLRNKIRAWVSLSRDRSSTVVDVLQEVVSQLLHEHYIQQQTAWIAQCTNDAKLRTALLLASIEEYCLRSIRHQPLIVYRFINHMRHSSKGGLTQVPKNKSLQLVLEQISTEDSDSTASVLDRQAIHQYQSGQAIAEQQSLRNAVKQEFSRYLANKLGTVAVKWLQLYLQGQSPQAIAQILNLPVKEVYRLREKVCYHATHIFAQNHPELISSCLESR